ncbi:MAG: peptidyl-prolyl cis-trans isomerase [Pseudomonadales bacterium]
MAVTTSMSKQTPTRLWREPLLWFALSGCLIFAISQWLGGAETKRIVVTQSLQQRLIDQWQGQMGRPPTAQELEGLTQQWVKEEIYSREAQAMGLDQNDTIIRRRLVQKLTFLTEDLATAAQPSDSELEDYYAKNLDRYREPARFDFEHRYFSRDRRDDASADAAVALAKIRKDPSARDYITTTGDSFMLQMQFAGRSERQIGDLFGREFAAALADLPPGQWHGPVSSAYGEHLVFISAAQAPHTQPFAQAKTRISADYAQAQREQANQAFFDGLRAQYEVEREALNLPSADPAKS